MAEHTNSPATVVRQSQEASWGWQAACSSSVKQTPRISHGQGRVLWERAAPQMSWADGGCCVGRF